MSEIYLIGVLVISYLLGSFPTSIIVSRLKANIDIRKHGSGNAGGTNVFRTLGWKPALIVLVVDMFKGWFPVFVLVPWLAPQFAPEILLVFGLSLPATQVFCGIAAILGHTFSIFAKFKGGKGVATFGGVILAFYPLAVPICILAFIGTLVLTGYASVSSFMASVTFAVLVWLLNSQGIVSFPIEVLWFSLFIPIYLLYTHRTNVKRLLQGNESRFEGAMIFKKK